MTSVRCATSLSGSCQERAVNHLSSHVRSGIRNVRRRDLCCAQAASALPPSFPMWFACAENGVRVKQILKVPTKNRSHSARSCVTFCSEARLSSSSSLPLCVEEAYITQGFVSLLKYCRVNLSMIGSCGFSKLAFAGILGFLSDQNEEDSDGFASGCDL